jgi:arylsulfatase A-like enzyme
MPDTAHLSLFAETEFDIPSNFYDDYEGREAAAAQHMSIHTEDMDLVYDLKMTDREEEINTRLSGAGRGFLKRMNDAQLKAWRRHYDPIIDEFKSAAPEGNALSEWKFQRYMRDYLRCIVSVDENVGRVLDYLEQQGLDENTLVVYTSDQGFYMGEHGWFDKRFMYEQSLRTPLLIRPPGGMQEGNAIQALVQNIDYAPTFLDMAGVNIPDDMQGLSLKPYLVDASNAPVRDAIYYHYYEYPNEHMVKRHYGVRTDRYKLIHFYFDIDTWELYDLQEDPDEMNNLIDDPAYDQIENDLREQLAVLQVQYGDRSFENPE